MRTVQGEQIIYVKNEVPYKTFEDVLNDADVKICAGPLSKQLTKAYSSQKEPAVRDVKYEDRSFRSLLKRHGIKIFCAGYLL